MAASRWLIISIAIFLLLHLQSICGSAPPKVLENPYKNVLPHLNFLSKMVDTHLPHCSMFFAGVTENPEDLAELSAKKLQPPSKLVEAIHHLNTIPLIFPSSVHIILVIRNPGPFVQASELNGTFSNFTTLEIEKPLPVAEELTKFVSAPIFEHEFWRRSLKKYTPFCNTVIFTSDGMAEEEIGEFKFADQGPMSGQGYLARIGLGSIINPRFYPMIKKNKDYFVFVAGKNLKVTPEEKEDEEGTLQKEKIKGIANMETNLVPLEISHSLLCLIIRMEREKENLKMEFIVKRNCLLCKDGSNKYPAEGSISWSGRSNSKFPPKSFPEKNEGKELTMDVAKITDWSSTSLTTFFPRTIRNLGGRLLKVSVTTGIPSRISLVKVDPKWDVHRREYLMTRGMYAYALYAFEKKFNFTSWPFPGSPRGVSRAGGSGNVQKDGSWSGVVGDVFNHRADFGFLCGETVGRYTYTELAGAIEFIFLTFTTGKQYPLYDWKAVFWPYSKEVWLCVCIGFVFGAFAIFFTQQIENRDNVKTATYVSTGRGTILVTSNDSFLDSLEFVIFAFFEAPTDLRGVGLIKVQLISSFWCLLGVVMANVYRGILVGLLAFPIYPPTPRDFSELSRTPEYKVGLQHYGGSAYEQITNSPNPALIKIRQTMILEPSPYKCYLYVSQGKFACIDYGTFGDYTILLNFTNHGGRSDLRIQPTRDYFLPVGPMFRRRSYLMETFRWAIGKVFDAGLTDWWIKMDYEDVRRQMVEQEREADPHGHHRRRRDGVAVILLTLKNFKGAFTTIGCGLGGGFLLFLLEFLTSLLLRPILGLVKDKFLVKLDSSIWKKGKEDQSSSEKGEVPTEVPPVESAGTGVGGKSMFDDPLTYNP